MFTVTSDKRDLPIIRLFISEKLINKLLINVIDVLSRASNPKDPPTVTQAREQELELIQKFIQ